MLEDRTLPTLTFSTLTPAPLVADTHQGESFLPLCIAATGDSLIAVDASAVAGGTGHASVYEWADLGRISEGYYAGGPGRHWAGFDIATGDFGGGRSLAVTVFDYDGGGSFVSILRRGGG
jgi:hypothetical protein